MDKTFKHELKQRLKILDTIIRQTKLYKKEIDREISNAYSDIITNKEGEDMCVISNILHTGTNFIYRNNVCKKNFLKKALAGEKPDEVLEEIMADEIKLKSLRRTASELSKSLIELRKRREELWNQIFSNK